MLGRNKFSLVLIALSSVLALVACGSPATSPTATPAPQGGPGNGQVDEMYFAGKTIRIIQGWGAGSNNERQIRHILEHLPRYIPGSPSFTITTPPNRAAYLAELNRLFDGPGDGLTMSYGVGGTPFEQLTLADEVTFRVNEFVPVFAFDAGISVWFALNDAPYHRLQDAIGGDREFTMALDQEGDAQWATMVLLKEHLDLPVRMMAGFGASTPEMMQLFDRRDAQTATSGFWYRVPIERPGWFADEYIVPFAIMADAQIEFLSNGEIEMPADVQNVRDFLEPEQIPEVDALLGSHTGGIFQRPAYMSRNTPIWMRDIILDAVTEMYRDPAFYDGMTDIMGRPPMLITGLDLAERAHELDVEFIAATLEKYAR